MFTTLIVIIILIAVLYWWYNSNQRREAALKAVIKYCQEMHVQLLDQSVHCYRVQLVFLHGRLRIKSTYRFDYTVHSLDRQNCHLILLSNQVQWIGAIKKGETEYTHASKKGDRVVHFSNYDHLKPKNDHKPKV